MNPIHEAATVFSRTAILHDAVRPAWTAEVVSWLLGSPVHGRQLEVLDLGAGTGLGTRAIAAQGHLVTAVDTDQDMLSVLRKSCDKLPPSVAARITAVSGSAESIPLADRCVDAIVCLQAWHWVDPGKATAECDRALRHDGTMGLAWQTWDRTSEWVGALAAIVERMGLPLIKPAVCLESLLEGAVLSAGISPSFTNCRLTNSCNLPALGLSLPRDRTSARSWQKSVTWVNWQ